MNHRFIHAGAKKPHDATLYIQWRQNRSTLISHTKQGNSPMVPLSTSDLNNSNTFPAFLNLPDEYEINDTYFSSTKPRKHWCFLGRVISSHVLVRLMLEVEDRKGHKILVAFHTEDRGAAFQALCTPGSTIAVLYATQHTFAFSPPGLRLEESAHIRVFPYTLEAMLRTSRAILERGRAAKCETCGRADGNMKKCARCKAAWYCSKVSPLGTAS